MVAAYTWNYYPDPRPLLPFRIPCPGVEPLSVFFQMWVMKQTCWHLMSSSGASQQKLRWGCQVWMLCVHPLDHSVLTLKRSLTLFWLSSKVLFEFLLCPAGQETVNYFGFGFCVHMFWVLSAVYFVSHPKSDSGSTAVGRLYHQRFIMPKAQSFEGKWEQVV